MILQRLISVASKLPDVSEEVFAMVNKYNTVEVPKTAEDLETLYLANTRQYQVETIRRTTVNLKNIEMGLVRAKHAVSETDEDFV